MSYRLASAGAEHVVTFLDDATFKDRSAFFALVDRLAAERRPRWIFDLGRVDFVDSAGLSLLIAAREVAVGQSGSITLRGANDEMRDVMELAKFSKLFVLVD